MSGGIQYPVYDALTGDDPNNDRGIDGDSDPETQPQLQPITPEQKTDQRQCDDPNDPSCTLRVVIGESMSRTRGAAATLDAQTWVGVPVRTPQAETCAANLAWIESMMDQGAIIFDIGIDASRQGSRSPYYELELRAVSQRGYPTIFTPWPPSPDTYYVEAEPSCPM